MPSSEPEARLHQLAADYIRNREQAALTIAFTRPDQRVIQGFGRVSSAHTAPPDAHTVYAIGSITKALTGNVLAACVNRGTVALTDTIRHYLPADVAERLSTDLQTLTLQQLATHTSGLPRLPATFIEAIRDPANPYADYTVQNLYADLEQITLQTPPGEQYAYSNLGMALLGHILSLQAAQAYEALVQAIVCRPLAMGDTAIALTPDQQQRLAPGYTPDGAIAPHWEFDVMAPAGAFCSTASDLLTYVQAYLQPSDTAVSKALARSRQPHFKVNSSLSLGLAWHISTLPSGQVLHWANGGTGGYISFIGFDQAHQTGVVILANYGDAFANDDSIDQMGSKLLVELA
jgi:D-alanyl-D-alanine-carboxypeptidase/D-alanyl-D-alanine-endopeptidase